MSFLYQSPSRLFMIALFVSAAGCTEASVSPSDSVPTKDATASETGIRRADALGELVTCFTTGMDEIGAKEVAKAKARFSACYAKDAATEATFPNGTKAPFLGSDAWAEFIAGFFQQKGYLRTQHLAGSVRIEPSSDASRADVAFEMSALHLFPSGFYDQSQARVRLSTVQQADGSWKIAAVALEILHFNTIGDDRTALASVASCAAAGLDAAAERDGARAKARLATCFAPDATVTIGAGAGPLVGPNAYADATLASASACTAAQIESSDVDILVSSPTEATIRSASTWRCRLASGATETRHTRIVDTVRRPGPADSTQPYGWTIANRTVTPTVQYTTP